MVAEKRDFDFAVTQVKRFIGDRYRISVIDYAPGDQMSLHSFSDDRIADFNPSAAREGGRNIKLHRDLPSEFKLFSILHLFGHIVQFNSSGADAALALSNAALRSLDDAEIAAAMDYEKRASQYGIAVLETCGLNAFVPWLSDFWAADWQFLEDVYRRRKPDVPAVYEDVMALLLARKAEYVFDSGGRNKLSSLPLPIELEDNLDFSPQGFRIL